MSILTPAPTAWHWPVEVRTFAARHEADAYLDPLRQVIQRLFPTARSVSVSVKADPEIEDDRHVVFEVQVPPQALPDFVEAKPRWHRELFAACPSTVVCLFRLSLFVVDV